MAHMALPWPAPCGLPRPLSPAIAVSSTGAPQASFLSLELRRGPSSLMQGFSDTGLSLAHPFPTHPFQEFLQAFSACL